MLKRLKSTISRPLTRRTEKFAQIHEGESCYVFGDGASVKWFDLSHFGNHPAICCGLLPFHKDFGKLDVRYCLMIDPWIFAPNIIQPNKPEITEFRRVAKEYRSIIKNNPDKQFFVSTSHWLSISGPNVNFMFRELPKSRTKTDDLLRQFDLFAGSFHAALTFAYYLGFKRLYLVGFDAWTLQPACNLRWYELGEGQWFEGPNYASEYLDVLQGEVDIYAISLNGRSQNVKGIAYETYTGQPPTFRENHELLSEYHLNVLATYPGLRIFK